MSNELRDKALKTGDANSSIRLYSGVRRVVHKTLFPYLRLKSTGADYLNLEGASILAPVHRSHLDSVLIAALSERRVRALAKESLFTNPGLGFTVAALGAIPVRRGKADKEALMSAKMLLDRGESMTIFPEGTRQPSHEIGELFDGVAWLAARTGARVIPIGISGTGDAMAEGSNRVRRATVAIVVAKPMEPPAGVDGKRAKRDDLRLFTEKLANNLAEAQDEALALARP